MSERARISRKKAKTPDNNNPSFKPKVRGFGEPQNESNWYSATPVPQKQQNQENISLKRDSSWENFNILEKCTTFRPQENVQRQEVEEEKEDVEQGEIVQAKSNNSESAGKQKQGQELLAHDLTHVVPQGGSSVSQHIQRGFFKKIKKGFKKLGGAIKKGAKSAWKGVKKIGGAVKKGAEKVWTGMKWLSTKLWSRFKNIFLRIINWITQLPRRVGRLLLTIWQGVKSLQPWSIKWWESLGQASTWKGLLKWLGTNIIYLLEIAGVGEMYETLMDFVKFNTRSLTSEEIAKAKIVFGNAINYSLVRVDEKALIGPSWTDRAYVSFNIINSWGSMDDRTLIHELTHVWQYGEMGAIYMPKAIHAQKAGGYDYGGLAELQKRQLAGQGIKSFNLEQQAEILADYYVEKKRANPNQTNLKTYEHFVADVRR